MLRGVFTVMLIVFAGMGCARFEQRAERYDADACPICNNITNGKCPYCNGTGKCMYCKGEKQRHVVSPNYSEEDIKPFSYKEPCPYCKSSGVCRYCNGSGKCWSCSGSAKVKGNWDCLSFRPETPVGATPEK